MYKLLNYQSLCTHHNYIVIPQGQNIGDEMSAMRIVSGKIPRDVMFYLIPLPAVFYLIQKLINLICLCSVLFIF